MWSQDSRTRLEVRFFTKIDVGLSPAGCWMWTDAPTRLGYGFFRVGQKKLQAHRFAYELLVGPVPPGLHLDHLCREPGCVNPLHLEPVTAAENNRRGRDNPNADKTHCDQGHLFDEANTYSDSRGWRGCRACRREAQRRYLAKKGWV